MVTVEELPLLKDEQQRHALLGALVDSLRLADRGLLRNLLAAKLDPVTQLPCEVLLIIWRQLAIGDVWRKRRVSRRWRDLLSSDLFVETALDRWDADPGERADEGIRTRPPRPSLATRTRNLRALVSGLPFSVAAWPIESPGLAAEIQANPRTATFTDNMQIGGHRVAWMSSRCGDEDRRLRLRDLVTGRDEILQSSDRSRILMFALNEDIVAFLSHSGRLCVNGPGGTKVVRVPSAGAFSIAVDKRIVAIVHAGAPRHSLPPSPNIEFILYDFDAGRMWNVAVPPLVGRDLVEALIRVDAIAKIIDLLIFEPSSCHPVIPNSVILKVVHFRCDFQGAKLLQSDWAQLVRWHGREDRNNLCGYSALQPTGIRNLFHASPRYITYPATPASGPAPIIYFDAKLAKIGGGEDFNMPSKITEHSEVRQWKGRQYHTRPPAPCHSLSQNFSQLNVETDNGFIRPRLPDVFAFPMTAPLPSDHNDSTVHTAMNESFIVGLREMAPSDHIRGRLAVELVAACFDESLVPPGFHRTNFWRDIDEQGC